MPHTPGPWKQVRRSATIAIEDGNGDILGEMYGKTTRPETEWHANARLIAAAPDLLAACKAASEFDYEEPMPDGRFPCDLVAAAIAKAEGS